mmetsp:Transcript_133459/g.266291  ORF Transcript_133459/g.266291 Transcript_133459/m.266291 type:complete len:351 (+) Transcript_133459:709-1761(+)
MASTCSFGLPVASHCWEIVQVMSSAAVLFSISLMSELAALPLKTSSGHSMNCFPSLRRTNTWQEELDRQFTVMSSNPWPWMPEQGCRGRNLATRRSAGALFSAVSKKLRGSSFVSSCSKRSSFAWYNPKSSATTSCVPDTSLLKARGKKPSCSGHSTSIDVGGGRTSSSLLWVCGKNAGKVSYLTAPSVESMKVSRSGPSSVPTSTAGYSSIGPRARMRQKMEPATQRSSTIVVAPQNALPGNRPGSKCLTVWCDGLVAAVCGEKVAGANMMCAGALRTACVSNTPSLAATDANNVLLRAIRSCTRASSLAVNLCCSSSARHRSRSCWSSSCNRNNTTCSCDGETSVPSA